MLYSGRCEARTSTDDPSCARRDDAAVRDGADRVRGRREETLKEMGVPPEFDLYICGRDYMQGLR